MNITPASRTNRYWRNIAGRGRMLGCIAFACALFAALPHDWRQTARVLIGWNAGVLVYLATTLRLMAKATDTLIRRRAEMIDEGRHIVLVLAVLAVIASFAAITLEVGAVKQVEGTLKILHMSLAGATIVTSWLLIHTIFAQHYAHEYFIERASEHALPEDERSGLRFPGSQKPDYFDFLYFSFVIGVASQTADVSITTRAMRRLSLVHCILAFFFNATVLALTINIAAGLI